uniref:Major facilitator superfamily (MFS) profile domain-containing protein n=1 Tax=Heliothis virescens TaxID=7102 RepID=A0A2A4K3T5_HELVI
MYSTDFAQALADGRTTPDDEWPIVPCQYGWEYNKSDVPYDTIASELDWVCEKDNLAATAQAIFFCGAIVGGLVFGWIADKYGRIPALVGTNLLGFIAGVGTSFCDSFLTFALCRFFVGLAFDNCFTMMYILVLEYVGPKWRTFVANMSIALFFTLAASLLPWIALWADDWRMFALGTSLPFALAILTPWMVPESARWLVSQGKIDKALTIMKKFERINKTKIPEKVLSDFTESSLKTIKESEAECRTYSVLDLFKTPRLRRNAILLIIIWMAISLVFDGHVRNVGSLGLDIFLTFTIASATELPADTFLTAVLDRWGRRWLACGSMVISGIFSLLATAVPAGGPSASLAIMGRFAVNISYNIGLQYAAELLPTVVRAQGVALIHIMGYVASIVAPFVVYLANISQDLPLLILGVLGVVGGLLCLFLPETMDTEMPQTLQDGENFGKDQRFWDNPCFPRKKPESSEEHPGKYTKRPSVSTNEPQEFVRAVPSAIGSRASIRASIRASTRASARRREVNKDRNIV